MHHTLGLLQKHNNKPNQLHSKALQKIIEGMASQLEENTARRAYPLACGLGKTTCVRGLIFAIHNLGLNYSVVISAGQVEALCNLKKDLIDDGIPEELIGLLHSKHYNPEKEPDESHASLPSNTEDQIENRPFVLVTHNKIKHHNTWIESYYGYKDKRRNLVIWDESLLSGNAISLSVLNIKNSIDSAINGYEYKFETNELFSALVNFLNQIKLIFESKKGMDDIAIKLPDLPSEIFNINQQIDLLVTNNDTRDLKSLFECLNYDGELRYIKEDSGAIIHFRQLVPDELDNIVILDASHCLRALTQFDPTIESVTLDCPKSYENLTIKYFKSGAGRNTIENEFFHKENSKLVAEVAEIIFFILAQKPKEPLLIWGYKKKGNKSIEEVIKKKLREMIPDIDFDVTDRNGNKIINFQTFGNELGLNGYTHCKHSIFIGLLYLKRSYVAGMIKGQSGNMDKDVNENNLLSDAVLKEQAHLFYQAVSRGSSRITEDGQCKEHTAYFFHSNPSNIKRAVNDVFPQANWERYESIHLNNEIGLYSEIAGRINDKLNSLTEEDFINHNPRTKFTRKISTRALKKAYFSNVERHQWSNSLRVFNDDYPWDWEIRGQSFVKSGH